MDSPTKYRGWLLKKGKIYSRKQWRSRFVVVENGILTYWNTEQDVANPEKELGRIKLEGTTCGNRMGKQKMYIKIITPEGRTYYFKTPDANEFATWKTVLQSNGSKWSDSVGQEDSIDEESSSNSRSNSSGSLDISDTNSNSPGYRRKYMKESESRKRILTTSDGKLFEDLLNMIAESNVEATHRIIKMKGTLLSAADSENRTCLHVACMGRTTNHVKIVETLVKLGSPINSVDDFGNTPLHYATSLETSSRFDKCPAKPKDINTVRHQVVEMLLKKGADANIRNVSGDTPLHNACFLGDEAVASLIVKKGSYVDVNISNNTGETPLLLASKKGIKSLVELLISFGAISKTEQPSVNEPQNQANLNHNFLFKQLKSLQTKLEADLGILLRIFLYPLKDKNLLSSTDIQTIFGNIEDLKSKYQQFNETFAKSEPSNVISVFLTWLPELEQLHKTYLSIYHPSEKLLSSKCIENPQLLDFLRECSNQSECKGGFLTLEVFLFKPIQHIQNLISLFKRTLGDCSNSTETDSLEQILQTLKSLDVIFYNSKSI